MAIDVGIERGSVAARIDQTADIVYTADTTLAAVTGLTFEMDAGVTYGIEGVLYGISSAAAQDIKAGAGANTYTGVWEWTTVPVGNVPLPAPLYLTADAIPASAVSDISGVTDIGVISFRGVISSATDATFTITAAQGTAAGTSTVLNSTLTAWIANQ